MERLVSLLTEPDRLKAAVLELPEQALEVLQGPNLGLYAALTIAVIALGCLVQRRWKTSLAGLLLAALMLAGPTAAGRSAPEWAGAIIAPIAAHGTPAVAAICFLAAMLLLWDAGSSRRRHARLVADRDALRHELADVSEQLRHERFWRFATGDERQALPSEEVLTLARTVQEPVVERVERSAPDNRLRESQLA